MNEIIKAELQDFYYAMADAYKDNSNLYKCVNVVQELFPDIDEDRLFDAWYAIDAYVDLFD